MDPYTYGDSPAAITLAKILASSPKDIKYKTTRIINRYFKGLKQILKMDDPEIRIYMANLWYEENLKRANFNESPNNEEFPITYIKNVMSMKFKVYQNTGKI